MPYELNEKNVAEAFASGRLPHRGRLVPMKVVRVGNLVVTTQVILAMDLLVSPHLDPFTQQVPNGRHPVSLAIADLDGDERIAFARIQFSSLAAVSWKMALTDPDTDPDALGPGQFVGYGVDACTGCFMDMAAATLMGQRYQEEGPYFSIGDVIEEEAEKTYQPTRSWADIRPIDRSEGNIICFTTGYGDGTYPSFFGFDADGEVCQLVTDFLIFGEEERA
ncbi:MAG TPA: DUF4241 domain-containing protein [Steroidobacteraceae bacterium]|nr:DUF4241 domain-containing protein [Steroidobacteraceae bacterium]